MILIEINDDTGFSHYDILGLDPADISQMDAKKASSAVNAAAKNAKKQYNRDAQRGDREAEERLAKVNQALLVLKDPDQRRKYDEELQQGKGQAMAVLQIQPVAAPFYRDRNARFRILERWLKRTGQTDGPDPTAAG